MINNIISNNPVISVSTSYQPWINFQGLSAGNLRYNPSTQNIEVYDGAAWHQISQNAQIYVDSRLEMVINWATRRMEEETAIRQKAARHPSVADALAAYELAKEKLDVVAILCEQKENAQKAA